MTNLSPLTSRSLLPTALPAQAENKPRADGVDDALPVSKAKNDLVSLSKNGIDLQQRVESLGHSTVDLAQNLVGTFAQQLFGDAGKDATISFDDVSLDTSATFAAGIQHSEGAGRVSDAAAFSLSESSHFIGKGTITTADGRKFDFEVEVQYDRSLEAAAGKSTSVPAPVPGKDGQAPRSAADPLPAVQFPDIHFPGSLQDLFRLFDKPLKSDVVQQDQGGGNGQKLGTLSLRLLNLVDNKGQQDIYHPSDRAKAVANAYGKDALPATPGALAEAQADAVASAAAATAPAAEPAATAAPAVVATPEKTS
ncbi:hypothetical protein GCM10027277_37480 [Pseudoduganella ginsengisoli]|uniref:Uncharacterized protein n=1 Tax=Pseudoduganella ginsengisoli TaxID=1462440 RepID=A0A6L6PZD6_9BURK|nr:hypothetical protein [Pseudoduganella ginsengisoli]MTW02368.1 hypothetical protein [Pseudoduganella ginsengisoli]